MDVINKLLLPYVLTALIELVLLIILNEKSKRVLLLSLGINFLTNISLNLFIYFYHFDTIISYWIIVISLEIVVVLIEFILYYLTTKHIKKSIFYSISLNLISFLIGLLLVLFM